VVIELSPEARNFLAEKGYDPAYGARPLKRVIQKELQDPLAGRLLAGEVKDGERIKIGFAKGELTFKAAGAVGRAA
jgi:ATP-dependent Clp protease ATP-binding subunit ClpB